jgi:hypothetical protein
MVGLIIATVDLFTEIKFKFPADVEGLDGHLYTRAMLAVH